MTLSFIVVFREAVSPPRTYIGVRPGHEGFYSMKAHDDARAIQGIVMYRFGGNLFFANIDTFIEDLEDAIDENTRVIIINASGINNVDITAADRLVALSKSLKKRNIRFFITENDGIVNDELKRYGAGDLIESGVIQKEFEDVFDIINLHAPFTLVEDEK